MNKKYIEKVFMLSCTKIYVPAGGQKKTFCESSKNGGLQGIDSSITSNDDVTSKQTGHVGGANKHI
jgi:hypothetical protein